MSGLFTAPAQVGSTAMTNDSNERIAEQTNAMNYKIQTETNQSNERMTSQTNQANRDIADATNATNMAINQANIDYQNAYNQQVFERADTAFQRSAKDASAVGINPLSLSGSVAGGDVAGSSSAPQSSLGAQTGAPMQSSRHEAAKMQAWQNQVADMSALGSFLSELNQLSTGFVQRDMLMQQAQRLKNENNFFVNNGYYPQNLTPFERLSTAIESAFSGRDNSISRGARKANEFSKDLFGIDWTQTSGSSSPKGKIKSLTIDPAVNAYNKVVESASNVIKSDNKIDAIKTESKNLWNDFTNYLKVTNPITSGIYSFFAD